jgi:5-methylthioadenosine/S-adenosylhomocysteine deaminase
MDKTVLKSATLAVAGGAPAQKDILVENGRFARIADRLAPEETENAVVVDCSSFAVMPAFYNGHTHAAMTLLRGYADDMELGRWLTEYIWPFEAKLTADDIETGSRLAVLEMIKSGTVFFADMYWQRGRTIEVVEEMGVRAAIGVTIADALLSEEQLEECFDFLAAHTGESDRVKLVVMPHSVYAATEATLRRCIEIARAENYLIHTHLCETAKEVADCQAKYGCGPVELWRRLGGLDDRFVAAHCVQFTESDIRAFAEAGATAVLNPTSNLKLCSGIPPVPALLAGGVKLALGTDGASSNNSLDMHAEMKLAALLAKVQGTAETLPAQAALDMATRNVARAYGLPDGAGEIREGAPADCLLVDLRNERMVPAHDLASNWVYAADATAIDSVLCAGRFLMRHRHVDGEEDILEAARARARRLAARQ